MKTKSLWIVALVFCLGVPCLGDDPEPPRLKAARSTFAAETRQAEVAYHKALSAAKTKLLNELTTQLTGTKDPATVAALQDEIKRLKDSIALDDAIAAGNPEAKLDIIMLTGDNNKLEGLFKGVAHARSGRISSVKPTAEFLADAEALATTGVVVWSPNSLRFTPVEAFTNKAQENIVRFVREGGDLWVFEQFGAEHTKVLEAMFGVKVAGGGGVGANIENAAMQKQIEAHSIAPMTLQEVHFYNTHSGYPKESEILMKGNKQSVTAFAGRYARGRLIFVGTDDTGPLIEATVDLVYGKATGNPADRQK